MRIRICGINGVEYGHDQFEISMSSPIGSSVIYVRDNCTITLTKDDDDDVERIDAVIE